MSMRQVLSSSQTPAAISIATDSDAIVSVGGRFNQKITATSIAYNLSNHASTPVLSLLIDGGANGGMAGNDIRVISQSSFIRLMSLGLARAKFSTFHWLPLQVSSLLIQDWLPFFSTSMLIMVRDIPSTPPCSYVLLVLNYGP